MDLLWRDFTLLSVGSTLYGSIACGNAAKGWIDLNRS